MRSDLRAKIRLFPTKDGGREGATPARYFGCLVEANGRAFDCRLLLGASGALRPGDAAEIPIKFLDWEFAGPHFSVGTRFSIREARVIGEGTVTAIDALKTAP